MARKGRTDSKSCSPASTRQASPRRANTSQAKAQSTAKAKAPDTDTFAKRAARIAKKEADAPKPASGAAQYVTYPKLKHLGGMREARAWGEQLARDLADYKAKRISWQDVDPGVLLYGPPGTGKTTFAHALAATCGIPLIATSYTQWQTYRDGHLGNLMRAMQEAIAQAKACAPCVLFIDELDSLPKRHSDGNGNNDAWWTSAVNALLELLDGWEKRTGVIVVGACNNPHNLDPALVRPGRFDRMIRMEMPSRADYAAILRYHLGDEAKGRRIDLSRAAIACAGGGMTGADVQQMVREARRIARRGKRTVETADLLAAMEGGRKRSRKADERVTAVHEAGHAVAALKLAVSSDIAVSIVRKDGRLGSTMLNAAESAILTRLALEKRITVLLAGRAAEWVLLGRVSGNAGGSWESDLAMSTRIASDIVTTLGLGQNPAPRYLGRHSTDNPVLHTTDAGQEVDAILRTVYRRAVELIKTERLAVTRVAEALIDKRVLCHKDLVKLARPTAAKTASKPAKAAKRLKSQSSAGLVDVGDTFE